MRGNAYFLSLNPHVHVLVFKELISVENWITSEKLSGVSF
jgi:hypothetical protein